MTAKEVIAIMKADGWYELSGKASGHRQFKHPSKPGKATVRMHPGDIPLPTLKMIERQTGLKFK
ncbi:MAG: type II toxin-antitoxin system HicA family toxin [Desulfovibrio sp.]|nr:type II toxin-antitoxin system HicA family toxin [Desulfovibrio sp.]